MESMKRHMHKPTSGDNDLARLVAAIANHNDAMGQLIQGIKTQNGARMLGAEPRVLRGVSQPISNSPGKLAGYAIAETAGATALLRLRHTDANGDSFLPITLAANASAQAWFMPGGISFPTGLYVEVVSGSIEGAVFLGTSL